VSSPTWVYANPLTDQSFSPKRSYHLRSKSEFRLRGCRYLSTTPVWCWLSITSGCRLALMRFSKHGNQQPRLVHG
jgi:hypothetical protein